MAQAFAKQFYRSNKWQLCRASFMASKFGLCERCGQPGSIVHHKIKLTPDNIQDPEISLNHSHLQLLCLVCHNITHGGASPLPDGLVFTDSGDIAKAPLSPVDDRNQRNRALELTFSRGKFREGECINER